MYHELLDRPIAYHRILARIAGSVSGGVFLSQALYWSKRTTLPDSWFYKTADEWFDETFLTRREQETVRKRLTAIKVLDEQKRGVPAKLYFRVNLEELERHILKHSETAGDAGGQEAVQTSFDKSAKLGSTNPPTLVPQKRQTNTETTTETTCEEPPLAIVAVPAPAIPHTPQTACDIAQEIFPMLLFKRSKNS